MTLSNHNIHVIQSGSKGNCTVIDNIMIDCGLPFETILPFLDSIQYILFTHQHGDHIKKSTIRQIVNEYKGKIHILCHISLSPYLIDNGVPLAMITPLDHDVFMTLGDTVQITCFPLIHDVPTCGYRIHFNDCKILYATDTGSISHIQAPNYDLYMIECNYDTEQALAMVEYRKANEEFCPELRTFDNHLSIEQTTDFLLKNMSASSQYVLLHKNDYLESLKTTIGYEYVPAKRNQRITIDTKRVFLNILTLNKNITKIHSIQKQEEGAYHAIVVMCNTLHEVSYKDNIVNYKSI